MEFNYCPECGKKLQHLCHSPYETNKEFLEIELRKCYDCNLDLDYKENDEISLLVYTSR